MEIPAIAKGQVIPYAVEQYIVESERLKEEREKAEKRAKEAEKRADLYFALGIICNIVCMIVGVFLGKAV